MLVDQAVADFLPHTADTHSRLHPHLVGSSSPAHSALPEICSFLDAQIVGYPKVTDPHCGDCPVLTR